MRDEIIQTAYKDTIKAMKLAQKRKDGNGHWLADQSLCVFLEIIGCSEIVRQYEKVPKAYTVPKALRDKGGKQ